MTKIRPGTPPPHLQKHHSKYLKIHEGKGNPHCLVYDQDEKLIQMLYEFYIQFPEKKAQILSMGTQLLMFSGHIFKNKKDLFLGKKLENLFKNHKCLERKL